MLLHAERPVWSHHCLLVLLLSITCTRPGVVKVTLQNATSLGKVVMRTLGIDKKWRCVQREVDEARARVDEVQQALIGELNRAKERERRVAAERAAQQHRAAQERAAAQREMQAAAAQARTTHSCKSCEHQYLYYYFYQTTL